MKLIVGIDKNMIYIGPLNKEKASHNDRQLSHQ